MITTEQKEKIKSIIGHRCSPAIQKELILSDQFNAKGDVYSSSHITNVMNGEKHAIIEAAIYRVVQKSLETKKNRKNLLNKKAMGGSTA